MNDEAPVIALILDPEQARELVRHLLECIEAPGCNSIALYCTREPIGDIATLDDMPDPDIIMAGSVTLIGMPIDVPTLTAHLDLKYRNPTRN